MGTITMCELSSNELGVEQMRRIDEAVRRNREKLSQRRRAERHERFALYNEEFKCRQHDMMVEATRLKLEAREERRLNRMKAKFEEWREVCEAEAQKERGPRNLDHRGPGAQRSWREEEGEERQKEEV